METEKSAAVKKRFLLETIIFRFHGKLHGCYHYSKSSRTDSHNRICIAFLTRTSHQSRPFLGESWRLLQVLWNQMGAMKPSTKNQLRAWFVEGFGHPCVERGAWRFAGATPRTTDHQVRGMRCFSGEESRNVLKGCLSSSWMLKMLHTFIVCPFSMCWRSCIWEVWLWCQHPSFMNSNLIITLQLCKHVTDATEIHSHVDLWWLYSSIATLLTTLKYMRKWPSQKQTNKFQRQKCLPKWPCPECKCTADKHYEWSFLDGWAERVILENFHRVNIIKS